MHRSPTQLDRVRGSLVCGAIGDALGYSVEFSFEEDILNTYGVNGITHYDLDPVTGLAIISDDTQMTLFTANALLYGIRRQKQSGAPIVPRDHALYAYLGWLITQQHSYSTHDRIPDDLRGQASCLLQDIPQLYARRAPGMTCMEGLRTRKDKLDRGFTITDHIADKINHSKGCGGVMRIAPVALALHDWDMAALDMEGAQLAAITHTHPLGYMPAALLTHILHQLVYEAATDLKTTVLEACDFVAALFKGEDYVDELVRITHAAVLLAENSRSDRENIAKLGAGWVAEEALAIALYCSLRYTNDLNKAIIVSVNHNGDSDSTGAITGNIMGALWGYDSIEQRWKEKLELHDLILHIADSLYTEFH